MRELYKDPAFREALEQNKASISGFHDGAGRYGADQSEIVLEVPSVTQQDIYSMGGHSSPFNQLVASAADEMYGRSTTAEEREALLLKVERVRSVAGPDWLNPEATQLVVTKLKPHAAELREIKRLQDRQAAGGNENSDL